MVWYKILIEKPEMLKYYWILSMAHIQWAAPIINSVTLFSYPSSDDEIDFKMSDKTKIKTTTTTTKKNASLIQL